MTISNSLMMRARGKRGKRRRRKRKKKSKRAKVRKKRGRNKKRLRKSRQPTSLPRMFRSSFSFYEIISFFIIQMILYI
jgi:hypothetical protein